MTESKEMEIYKDIHYNEYTKDRYKVSTQGTVINKKTNRILIPFIRSGYPTVLLPIGNGKARHFPLHKLVASAFLPNPCNYPQINHKDQDKLNPCVENLECNIQTNFKYDGSCAGSCVFGNR